MESISNNLVRFAALVSAIGTFSVYSQGNAVIILLEIVMIAIYLQMDYGSIIDFLKRNNNKKLFDV